MTFKVLKSVAKLQKKDCDNFRVYIPRIQLASANLQHLFVESLFGSWEIAVLCWTSASCLSLVFVWSFPLFLVLCPSGTHEILGTKVGSPGTTPRNAVAIGREFCRQPSAYCLQYGYSRKIPDQFLGLWSLAWLPLRRAKNCLYPKGRSIKKLHTKETDNKKNVCPLSGGRFLKTTSFT